MDELGLILMALLSSVLCGSSGAFNSPPRMPYSMRKHTLIKVFAVFLLYGSATAQTRPSKATKATLKPAPPVFEIKLSEDSDLGSMPWAKDWPTPAQGDCDEDGNLYIWRWPPGQGMAAFTPKGSVTFLTGQMTDIPTPFAHGGFVSESGVYVGVDGIENPEQKVETGEDAEGHKFTTRKTEGERRRYIARFDKDEHTRVPSSWIFRSASLPSLGLSREPSSRRVWTRTRSQESQCLIPVDN